MTKTDDITWAPLIPLIGGQMLGAEKAFKKPPIAIYSYDGFQSNDEHYVHYQQNIKGRKEIQYINLDSETVVPHIDVISGTPPCAALSQLNTGKTEKAKGAKCAKNDWMYKVFIDGIDRFGAKVVIVENAPALFTNKGKGVANRLYEICNERGYSLTLFKTSTMYHGIPQNRDRCFAIGWQSEKAPIIGWYKRPSQTLKEHLKLVDNNELLHQDTIVNPHITNEPFYNYIKHIANENPRDVMINAKVITAFNYISRQGKLEDALKWFYLTNNEKGIKYATHALKKNAMGKGIWDRSVHVFNERMNAVIGRNLNDTIHPIYDRSLTIREALHMMGFPHDFELLGGRTKINHIAQNVPVTTSRDIHTEIAKFLRDELPLSDTNYLRQNNHTEKMESDPLGSRNISSLMEFIE